MEPQGPLVSVVIPNFNGGPFLRPAVESILNQTYQDLEVIVVDDGSTDASLETVASIGDPRLTVITLPSNTGQNSVVRNIGIARSSGPLIATLDNEDLAHPGRIAAQVARFASNPSLALLGTGSDVVDEHGARVGPGSSRQDLAECCDASGGGTGLSTRPPCFVVTPSRRSGRVRAA